jgi:hypothetical protein
MVDVAVAALLQQEVLILILHRQPMEVTELHLLFQELQLHMLEEVEEVLMMVHQELEDLEVQAAEEMV